MRKTLIAIALASTGVAFAQHSTHEPVSSYASMMSRDIKALSSEQVADLREGKGMGASLPAELNGVPGPLHVLQLAGQLGVTPEQRAALQRITDDMKASAQQLGQQVIDAEAELDRVFRTGTAEEAVIRQLTTRIAALQGRLRAVHLVAHLRTQQLLSRDQIARYAVARGYAQAPAENRHRQ